MIVCPSNAAARDYAPCFHKHLYGSVFGFGAGGVPNAPVFHLLKTNIQDGQVLSKNNKIS